MKDIDTYRGCLVGGAVGDALGYTVEFWDEDRIFSHYGKRGITEYELDAKGAARFSDDTQMTLFTANGLLLGTTRGMTRGIMGSYASYVAFCYGDWYRTQTEDYTPGYDGTHGYRYSWLMGIPELFARRAPGNTCLAACASGHNGAPAGTPSMPVNNSKGCGGVMRVAPVGLYLNAEDGQAAEPRSYSYAKLQRVAAECAALTHGHELGWLPAGLLAHIVSRLAHDPNCDIRAGVEDALQTLPEAYPDARHVDELTNLVRHALRLADSRTCDLDCIHQLGEGWVAEEALAIAVFCAARHEDDFEGAMVSSVNHGGDSDSTGAICGNILGAKLGLSAIPSKFTESLELLDLIRSMADDLYNDGQISEFGSYQDDVWEHKYIHMDYVEWAEGRHQNLA